MKTEDLVFRAVAHPVRQAILSILATSDRSVKELTGKFSISQPAVSQHLKELKDAQLVASVRVGLEQRYRLTPQPLKHIMEWSARYRGLIDPAGHVWSFVEAPKNTDPKSKQRRSTRGSERFRPK